MGLRHRTLPQWGVQFHPESISTEHSLQLLNNFARLTREWTGGASTEHDRTGADSTTSDQLIRSTRSVAPTGEKAITDEVSNLVALHVEVLDQSASSEQIFVSLYGHEEESVWLDGNRPGSPSSRFSIMAAPTGPNGRVATADANTGTIRIRHNGHLPSPTGQTQRPRAPSSIS